MTDENNYEKINEKNLYLKMGKWMGETSQAVSDIVRETKELKDDFKVHITIENKARNDAKEMLSKANDMLATSNALLSKAVVCPHEEKIVEMGKGIQTCNKDRGIMRSERKWIYGGLGLAYTGLLAIMKKLWS